jgi:CheY-like chemotaxis protein
MRSPKPPTSVLIVDDDAGIRSYVGRVLRVAGYAVAFAKTGLEGLSKAKEGPFDLYVLDFNMPGMRGDEVARYLRQDDPHANIMYFTGFCAQLFEAHGVLGEGETVLEKPVTARELLEGVSLALFGHSRALQAP